MKGKQGTQILVLGAVLLVLIVAVIYQFGGKKPAPTPGPKAPTNNADVTTTRTGAHTPVDDTTDMSMSWVVSKDLSVIVSNVAGGRDPFVDRLAPAQSTGSTARPSIPRNVDVVRPFGGSGSGPFFPPPLPPDRTPVVEPPRPVEPPIPQFVLSGVISTQNERYASIVVGERYYTLLEGETFPGLGWSVIKIEASSVILQNDSHKTQTVLIRLPGGSPK